MTKKAFSWVLIVLCSFGMATAQTFTNDKIDILAGSSQYFLNEVVYKPANFSTTQKYPLVLFFHGLGEAGTDVNKLYNTGLPKVLKNGYKPSFDFIMVAVQHNSYSLDPKYIQQVLDETVLKFPNIDQSRIYLTGLSAGGFPVWGAELNVDAEFGKKFAGIVIMSGALQDANKSNFSWWQNCKTPLWAVVGDNDGSYRDQNRDAVNEINNYVPGLASITIRPGVGHGGWDDVYNGSVKTASGKTMWEWLSQFTRTSSGVTTGQPVTNTPPTVNAGADINVTLPSTAQLSGTATDAGGSVVALKWAQVSGPTSAIISSVASATTALTSLVAGTYVFALTATDNLGATATDAVNITVTAPIVGSSASDIRVNLSNASVSYSNTQWNNWNASVSSSDYFKFSDGTSSTVKASFAQSGMADNGSSYVSGMAPQEVLRFASYSTSKRTLVISGLNNAKKYDIELYSSRGTSSNNTTRFTVGSTTVDVKADNNANNKASFSSLTPSGGQIIITLDRLNTFNYLNGFVIIQK